MRKDSAEAVDMITDAATPAHVIRRLMAASADRVRNVLLDPTLQTSWTLSGTQTTRIPPVILEQGDVILKEFVQGHAIDVRVRVLERTRFCEVHVELRIDRSFDLNTFYGTGIDDLWETRLYAIADLMAVEPF